MTFHKMIVNDAKKNYLSLHEFLSGSSQTALLKVTLNSSAADNCFERIARALRTDDNFLLTDNPGRSNK